MTFGALPFLLAGLAAAIPIVLHMIHRRKVKDLPFPTLRFLRLSVEKTRRRKRIHDLFLMLLRMAVLILIALGLAKPTLTSLSSLWGGGGSAVAIILDNSASMGVVDQGPDREQIRFRTALRAAEQIMDELRDGDRVMSICRSNGLAAGRQFMVDVETPDPEARGKGYALLTATALVDHAIEAGLEPLWETTEFNTPSRRLARRLSFTAGEPYPVYAIQVNRVGRDG